MPSRNPMKPMSSRTPMKPMSGSKPVWRVNGSLGLLLVVWFSLLIGLVGWQYQRRRLLLDALPSQPIDRSIERRHTQMQGELQDGHRWLERVEPTMLSTDVSSLLSSLTQWAEETGVQIVGTSQSAVKRESIYRIAPFQVEIQGEFGSLVQFLHRFEREYPHLPLGGMVLTHTSKSAKLMLGLRFHLLGYESGKRPPPLDEESRIAFRWESSDLLSDRDGSPRNPFMLPSSTAPTPQPTPSSSSVLPTLTGVVWDARHPVAILEMGNRLQMLRKHEALGGFEVVDIGISSVTLRQGESTLELQLWPTQSETSNIQVQ